ncbi:hypothetical protein BaRGS_00000511 [Batillaria attramentaria]|uniref:EF-hand domain-containing protein n=1 Tax=Batillaria attramentaria TaxID=370345 RepID=A0ABD0MA57_9CAEN
MGEISAADRKQTLQHVFNQYDLEQKGELTPIQVQILHGDIRMGGLSLPQVLASIKYSCVGDVCQVSELHDLLQEMDRRYFLLQDLRWEFSLLDRQNMDAISVEQARWLIQAVHGKHFSRQKWERFLKSRAVPGSSIGFAEIEVMLCDIPSRTELKDEEDLQRQEEEEEDRLRKEREEEEERRRRLAEEEQRKREEKEEMYKNVEKHKEDAERAEKETDEELKKLRKQKDGADEKKKAELEDKEKDLSKALRDHRHRRIRYQLKAAVKSRDKFQLEYSITEFKEAKLSDDDMDLEKAQRLLRQFNAKEGLHKAMSKREIQELERAMTFVRTHGFEIELAHEMTKAHHLLGRLRRLERIRHEILELKQSTVAEIRSYTNPPPIVHTVMTAVFLLLGHQEKETRDWKAVQALVGKTGKESLKRRCLELKADKLPLNIVNRSKTLLGKFELDEVRDISAGAATFYVWATATIEDVLDKDHED